MTRCPLKEGQNYPKSSQDRTWFYKEWRQIPKSYSSGLFSYLRNEAWAYLQPRCYRAHGAQGEKGRPRLRPRAPVSWWTAAPISPPRHLQHSAWGLGDPISVPFPRSLVPRPAFLKGLSWELGGGFCGLSVTDGQRHCSNIRKKTSYPKLYKILCIVWMSSESIENTWSCTA